MRAVLAAVDELLQVVADPGYVPDSFTFQPLREARRKMLPGPPEDCHDPACGGFLCVPMPGGELQCNVTGCTLRDRP